MLRGRGAGVVAWRGAGVLAGRGALGLRGRIVGAVIVTTVVTLAVAAVALLGPLEQKLRAAEFKSFQSQVPESVTRPFANLDLNLAAQYDAQLHPPPPGASKEEIQAYRQDAALQPAATEDRNELLHAEGALASPVGASEVAVVGSAGGGLRVIARSPFESTIAAYDGLGDAARVLASPHHRPLYSTASIDGSEYARAALPFTTPGPTGQPTRWAVVIRKPFVEVNDAVHAVRVAFLDAAIAALALTLLVAIPLSFTIVRRLRRLREAALELAEGGTAVEVPADRARDEVGDLTRTFSLMQEQLQHQEEARRAFVATASHELRTPLTSLEGMLELLQEDLDDAHLDLDDARSLVARARVQSHRLGRLAADLLDLSRLDAQVALRSEPIELGELSRAVLAEFELGSTERGVIAEIRDPGVPVWALGDPGSVARVLRILLDNALRVSPPGTEIMVELQNGDRAALSVCDQGPGVAEHERELIFERFHRGRNTGGQAGFGLGLAIGRELAVRMGGELVLEDRFCGAKFTLRLPVAAAPEQERLAVH